MGDVVAIGQAEAVPRGWTADVWGWSRWIPEQDWLVVKRMGGRFVTHVWIDDPAGGWTEDAGPDGEWVTLTFASLVDACRAAERRA